MADYLADFPRAASLGFEAGRQQAQVNPVGQFIRGLLGQWQKRQDMEYEYKMKTGQEKDMASYKQGLEEASPLNKAQTKAYNSLAEQRDIKAETPDIDLEMKAEAWQRYKEGDKSPEVLKAIGRYVSPMDVMLANSLGFGGGEGNGISSIIPQSGGEGKSERKQFKNKKTGNLEWFVKKGNKWVLETTR